MYSFPISRKIGCKGRADRQTERQTDGVQHLWAHYEGRIKSSKDSVKRLSEVRETLFAEC